MYDLHSFRFFPYPGPRMDAPHAHNDIELNLVAAGSVTYLFGPRHLSFEAGDLCVFWAAIPHQIIHLDEATHYFAIHLLLTHFLQWQLPRDFTPRILRGEQVLAVDGEDADFQRARFERWHRHIHADHPEYQRATLLEIEAMLRCLALSVRPAPAERDHARAIPGAGVEEIEVMVEVITRRFQESLTVGEVAAAVNLHPNYAMQLFRRYTGRTIIGYLNQYRIAHAQQLLLTTDKSVLDIAYDSGFSSLSRFYAVFRKSCNLSPGRYRQTLGRRA